MFKRMLQHSVVLLTIGALASSISTSVAMPPVRHAVELTYLKAHPGQRAHLRRFIVLNWFAMDKIAMQRGLIERFNVVETGSDDGRWNVLVTVGYANDRGYDGVKSEFEAIRSAHKTVLVDGKSLAELGAIVETIKTYEELGDRSH